MLRSVSPGCPPMHLHNALLLVAIPVVALALPGASRQNRSRLKARIARIDGPSPTEVSTGVNHRATPPFSGL